MTQARVGYASCSADGFACESSLASLMLFLAGQLTPLECDGLPVCKELPFVPAPRNCVWAGWAFSRAAEGVVTGERPSMTIPDDPRLRQLLRQLHAQLHAELHRQGKVVEVQELPPAAPPASASQLQGGSRSSEDDSPGGSLVGRRPATDLHGSSCPGYPSLRVLWNLLNVSASAAPALFARLSHACSQIGSTSSRFRGLAALLRGILLLQALPLAWTAAATKPARQRAMLPAAGCQAAAG